MASYPKLSGTLNFSKRDPDQKYDDERSKIYAHEGYVSPAAKHSPSSADHINELEPDKGEENENVEID